MVLVVFLHMLRVFFTGAYRAQRAANWLVGLVLLLLTLLLSFTGYLLPWDQLAFWAVTVGTNIAKEVPLVGEALRFVLLGGTEIGQSALVRFYVLHVVVLPAAVHAAVCLPHVARAARRRLGRHRPGGRAVARGRRGRRPCRPRHTPCSA